MGALTNEELESRRDEMIEQLTQYKEQISEALDQVADSLRKGEYAGACSLMGTISAHQAQTSIKLRSVLVKHGFIVREQI